MPNISAALYHDDCKLLDPESHEWLTQGCVLNEGSSSKPCAFDRLVPHALCL